MNRWTRALGVAGAISLAGVGAWSQTSAQEKKSSKEQAGSLVFEVTKDAKGEFRWRLKAANNKVIATSGEGYKAKADCLHGIDLIKEGAAKATTEDSSEKP